MTSTRRLFVPALMGLLLLALPAGAAEFYGIKSNGFLLKYDTTAMTVTQLAQVQVGPQLLTGFTDLEFDSAGNLFALRGFSDGNFPPTTFNQLIRVNTPATGSSLLSGDMGNLGATPFHSLAYRPSNGSFYSVDARNGHLITVTTAGAIASVAGVANGLRFLVPALAVNPVDGLAYGIIDAGTPAPFGTPNYSLIRMNMDTGLSTLVGSLGQGANPFTALRFDNTGTAYTVNQSNGDVFSVNTATGAASFLFAGGAVAAGTTGLAFIVPAPATASVLLAFAAFAARRRR